MAYLASCKMIFSLAITGPTASGKTALSLEVAKRLSGEIIGCDSMQIYKKMNIGTAKPTAEEQAIVPHHMIDFLSPEESFSAQSYREMAIPVAEDVVKRGNLPIFVGGTGLYVDSLMRVGAVRSPESDPEYRERLLSEAETEGGCDRLYERLRTVDPGAAETIHKNNVKRVIRALEIYDKTGMTKTELDKLGALPAEDIRVGMITLDFHNRETLYKRVDKRVDVMIDEGLLDETRSLYSDGLFEASPTASQAIGYKEMLPYLKGECDLDTAIEALKLATRRYAKRQLTWFRHERDAVRLYLDDESGAMRPFDEIVAEAVRIAEGLIYEYNIKFAER